MWKEDFKDPQYICQWRDEIIAIPHGHDEGTADVKD